MNSKVGICCIGLAALSFSSCLKTEEFPPIPSLEFKSLEIEGTRGVLTVEFKDGDGDVGLNEGDTLPPYQFGGDYYYNLIVDYYEMKNGEWSKVNFDSIPGSATFSDRIPNLTPEGQNKKLEGEIEQELAPFYYLLPSVSTADTFQFRIRLIDRALNVSNEVESQVLIRP